MPTFTVIGLVDDDSGEMFVAGVVAGKVDTVDTGMGSGGFGRWADSFEAESAEEAIVKAHEAVAAELAGLDEGDLYYYLDASGNMLDTSTDDLDEAKDHATEKGLAVVLDDGETILADYRPGATAGPDASEAEREAWVADQHIYNEHSNQLGDWCPWSGQVAEAGTVEGDPCPAVCPASRVIVRES